MRRHNDDNGDDENSGVFVYETKTKTRTIEGCIDDQRQCEPAVVLKQFSGDVIHNFATLKISEFFISEYKVN